MGLSQATAIGVGGMIGAGIFSVMGVAANMAGSAAGVSFAVAGALALLCGWSFGRLGSRFPSAGGPIEYLTRGLGDNTATGSLNLLLWAGYVLAMAMYARAFGSYGASLMPEAWQDWAVPFLAVAVTGGFLALNLAGAKAVGRVELAIVAAKVLILVVFIAAAAPGVDASRIEPAQWPGPADIVVAAAIVFLSYEGFGLITNAAEDMRAPRRTLPRSILLSVGITIVLYVLVAFTVLGTVTVTQLEESGEQALALAAQPTLGRAGFIGVVIAALFSTASAINATLYGGANVSLRMAEKGSLPSIFRKRVWMGSPGGLIVTGALVAVIGASFDVADIAMSGSAAFLVVYGAVNVAHFRLRRETGASRWPILGAVVGCASFLGVLVLHLSRAQPSALVGLGVMIIGSILFEWLWWRVLRSRELEERRGADAPRRPIIGRTSESG